MKYITLCLVIITLTVVCNHREQDWSVLPPAKMEKIIAELIEINEFIDRFIHSDTNINNKRNNERIEMYQQIFKSKNTNQQEFLHNLHYYKSDIDRLTTLLRRFEKYKEEVKDYEHGKANERYGKGLLRLQETPSQK